MACGQRFWVASARPARKNTPIRAPGEAYYWAMTQTVPGFDRLTVEHAKLSGQPCSRGYRFSAQQLLELLAAGNTFEQIHDHFDFLEEADLRQVLGYAAQLAERDFYLPTSQTA